MSNNYQLLTAGLMYCILMLFIKGAPVRAECPQMTFRDALVRVCAPKQCLDGINIRGCVDPSNVFPDAVSVQVSGNVPIFRRGAFQNLPQLTRIDGLPMHLKKIYPGAFLNLPGLQVVNLDFNSVEEIQWGVFSNSNISKINLNWNTISFIENEAFGHMKYLKSINLIENRLKEYNRMWFTGSTSVEVLLLGFNEIDNIRVFDFDTFPNLTYCDLSFNKIKKIDSQSFNNVLHLKQLDLTSNRLSWIPVSLSKFDMTINELRVSLNRLSFLSTKLLDKSKVKEVFLHPNPWQCPCYQDVLGWLGKNNATLKQIADDHRIKYISNLPICAINPKSPHKCVIGYDESFAYAQEEFFKVVNYSESIRYKPTSERPNFDILPTAPPLYPADLSPLDMK